MLLSFIIYEVFSAIYCVYICINSEELYEFNAYDKAHRLWIDKEAIALMAPANSHLENSILDVWSIIMNKKQLSRQTTRPSRFFFTTYAYVSHTCWRTWNGCKKLPLFLFSFDFYSICRLLSYMHKNHPWSTRSSIESCSLKPKEPTGLIWIRQI